MYSIYNYIYYIHHATIILKLVKLVRRFKISTEQSYSKKASELAIFTSSCTQ